MSLDDFYKKITEKFDTKLSKTIPVADFPAEVQILLNKLYDHSSLTSRLTATLLNGIFSETRTTFLMSKNLLTKLVEEDCKTGNLKIKSFDDSAYKTFVAILREKNIIEVIEESEQISSDFPQGKSGTWQLIDCNILRLFILYFQPHELNDDGTPNIDPELFDEEITDESYYQSWLNPVTETLVKPIPNVSDGQDTKFTKEEPKREKQEVVKKPIKYY